MKSKKLLARYNANKYFLEKFAASIFVDWQDLPEPTKEILRKFDGFVSDCRDRLRQAYAEEIGKALLSEQVE